MTRPPLVDPPEAVAIVALDGMQAVVVRQRRPGAPVPTVELPAGSVEPGETPAEAARRELAEECGLAAERWRPVGTFWLVPSYSTELVHVFEAQGLRPADLAPDDDEEIAVERVAVACLPAGLCEASSLAAYALWADDAARRAA